MLRPVGDMDRLAMGGARLALPRGLPPVPVIVTDVGDVLRIAVFRVAVAAGVLMLSLLMLTEGETTAAAACEGGEFSSVACCRTKVLRRGEADLPVVGAADADLSTIGGGAVLLSIGGPLVRIGTAVSVSMRIAMLHCCCTTGRTCLISGILKSSFSNLTFKPDDLPCCKLSIGAFYYCLTPHDSILILAEG